MSRRTTTPGRRRPATAGLIGVGLTIGVTAVMAPVRGDLSAATPALALVLPIVAAGLSGGRRPALLTAVAAAAAYNLAFLPPHWTLKVASVDDAVALLVFGAVAVSVGTLVAREGDRRTAADDRAKELARVNSELMVLQGERERLTEEATRAAVLQRVDEQRSALLRSVSHDLRTPLSSIRGVASDLLTETNYDDATRTELLTLVASEAERLDRLVANLLSLSRIEAGALRPDRQAVPLDELIGDTVKRLERLWRGRRVQVDLPSSLPLADGDYTQISQVVSNLLENASRHAPPDTTIRASATATADMIVVCIDDEGLGIAPFEAHHIFEAFRRGKGSTSSGVGLAICKAIVEAHGGAIEAVGAPGGGARFMFSLPVHHG